MNECAQTLSYGLLFILSSHRAFTSGRKQNKGIDTRICKADAEQSNRHELYRYVVIKRELSNTAKLSIFKSVFVPILTYCHESWVIA